MTNLIDQLTSDFRGDVLNRVSSALGENPGKIQAAIASIFPALFAGLANKSATTEGAADLLEMMRRSKFDAAQLSDVASAVTAPDGIASLMRMGRPLLEGLFGAKSDGIAEWVASSTGIGRSSASSLLTLGLPLVLGQIGKNLTGGWNASSLMEALKGQRTFLQNLPAGLGNIFGAGDFSSEGRARMVRAYDTETVAPAGTAWWKWALPVLAALLLLGFFIMRRPAEEATRTRTDLSVPNPAAAIADLGAFIERSMPNGISLRVPSNGIESKLLAFIQDPGKQVDKDTWFSFDRLEFETDSAQLKPTSDEQLRNIAEIMKAYPQVNVKIGGYTDNTGNAAHNMTLSSERATNTMNAIISRGIDKGRLEAEGYGEQFPVADNSTEQGRQRNRRIDIRVTKK